MTAQGDVNILDDVAAMGRADSEGMLELVAGLESRDHADDGRLHWSSPFPLDGLVLLGTSDARVLALELEDGAIIWEAAVSSEVLSVPQIDRGVGRGLCQDGRG